MALAIVIMECGHHANFGSIAQAPMIGETCHCTRCNKEVEVTDSPAGTAEYRWRCKVCKAGRRFGEARVTCEMSATKHATTRDHTVEIIRGNRILKTWTHQGSPLPLPAPLNGWSGKEDPPPF